VTNAFVNGLISNDWRVEITTASSQTPTDLSSYDLLVLGSPIYADTPLRPIMDYVSNVDDLEGMDTVILLTGGAGTGAEAPNILGNHVQEANGIVVKTLMLYSTQASNEAQYGAQYGTGDPLKIATKAGQEIPLP
jgi:flavorubredoxin